MQNSQYGILPIHDQYKIKDDVADSLMSTLKGIRASREGFRGEELREETTRASERGRLREPGGDGGHV